MNANRFWIEIVWVCAGVALALALGIATIGIAVAAFGQAADSQAAEPPMKPRTYEGMVTCSRCGAKHSAALGKTAADCARICVSSGAAFALVNGDRTYSLDGDATVLQKVAGRRARLVGVMTGNTIRVSAVATGS